MSGIVTELGEEPRGNSGQLFNKAIQQLDSVIQQNAGASEEMSATSEELASQAEHLQQNVSFFRTDNQDSDTKKQPLGDEPFPFEKNDKSVNVRAPSQEKGHLNLRVKNKGLKTIKTQKAFY